MNASKDTLLKHYQDIADISAQMRALAQSQQWDDLVALGQQYHDAVNKLRHLGPLGTADRAARRDLLVRILDDDAQIRRLVAPELDRLGHLLGTIKRQRTVLQTYYSTVRPQ